LSLIYCLLGRSKGHFSPTIADAALNDLGAALVPDFSVLRDCQQVDAFPRQFYAACPFAPHVTHAATSFIAYSRKNFSVDIPKRSQWRDIAFKAFIVYNVETHCCACVHNDSLILLR
jgi:hypothetical protein